MVEPPLEPKKGKHRAAAEASQDCISKGMYNLGLGKNNAMLKQKATSDLRVFNVDVHGQRKTLPPLRASSQHDS